MLDQFGLDPELSKVVNMFVWYILPVTNVDGYVYTWEKVITSLIIHDTFLAPMICSAVEHTCEVAEVFAWLYL